MVGERRRVGRVRLDVPLAAHYAERSARVLEVSIDGFLIAHEHRVAAGDAHRLVIEWDGRSIDLECVVTRSTIRRLARALDARTIYHSGLRIVHCSHDAFHTLCELIADRIVRALEEQKANARGIPPLAAYMYRYQPGKGELYRRCEFVNGVWRRSETANPSQPMNGFTISAEVDPQHVEMLCHTWESTTAEGRRLTRILAELSISKVEGVPTRRYEP